MYSDTDLEDHGFSDNEIRLLRNICQGDHNHKKGDFYEKSFTLHELLSYSTQFSQKEQEGIIFSNSEGATVDDLTVILEGKRINYQLKNSSTKGAWNKELEIRFDLQAKLDEKYHKVEGKSILVCSDKATVEKNKHKIPANISVDCRYYPSHENWFSALKNPESNLEMLIQQVCPDSAQHETACRLLLAPYNDGIEFRKNLSEWWEDVLKSSKPDIFSISIADVDLSAEVVEVLEARGCKIANGVIVCGEMMVTLSATLIKALEEADNLAKLQASSTMPDIIKVLTELAILSSGSRGSL